MHSTRLRHSRGTSRTTFSTSVCSQIQQCTFVVYISTYVDTQLSPTTVVGVTEGQQAAGQDSVVLVSMIQNGTMQVEGGGGQFRDWVEVIVGQYGCADVLMVIWMVLTVVMVLRLVVVYVVGVGLQVGMEVVRCADVYGRRESRLEGVGVSFQGL